MALAALIIACETADGEREGLRATLPLLGATLVEHQARQAVRLGAEQIVILVARVPPALVAALDRLRRDGLRVNVARNLPDAADRIHPDERLLLIGDGCLADLDILRGLAAGLPPMLLVLADRPDRERLELIDARARWAGAALLDGKALRRTAAMLGDWDAQSTLLRAAVQAGATRIDSEAGGSAVAPTIVADAGMAAVAERRLAGAAPAIGQRWPARQLLALPAAFAARLLAPRRIEAVWLAGGGVLMCCMAVPLAWRGHLWPALALILASGLLALTADRVAGMRLARTRWRRWTEGARAAAMLLALAGVAAGLAAGGQWGWWTIAAAVPAGIAALAGAERVRAATPTAPLADADGLAWLFLPGLALGGAATALVLLAAYALASFAYAQMRLAAGGPR